MEGNKIYQGNCLELIKKIDNKSINAIITDPPYFVGMTHNGKKGEISDLVTMEPFYDLLFKEFSRVLKDDGFIYLFCDWRTYHFYYPIIAKHITVRNMLVWDKKSGPGSAYSYRHELIIFCNNSNANMKGSSIIDNIPSFSSGAKKMTEKKYTLLKNLQN